MYNSQRSIMLIYKYVSCIFHKSGLALQTNLDSTQLTFIYMVIHLSCNSLTNKKFFIDATISV